MSSVQLNSLESQKAWVQIDLAWFIIWAQAFGLSNEFKLEHLTFINESHNLKMLSSFTTLLLIDYPKNKGYTLIVWATTMNNGCKVVTWNCKDFTFINK